jgi:hypothetical protein
LLDNLKGSPDRSTVRQLKDSEECALVIFGQEACRRYLA